MIRTARSLSNLLLAGFWLVAGRLPAQQQVPQQVVTQQVPAEAPPQRTAVGDESLRPNYVLGAGDQIIIHALDMEEIGERPVLIDGDGNINVPRLGIVKAAGLSIPQMEASLVTLLRKYVKEPQVTVSIAQFRSEPVFFEGSFQRAGVFELKGRRTLIEMITTVGGLQPNAGRSITLTRRKEIGSIPLPNAVTSTDGRTMTVTISMASLRNDINPAENIILEPYDVIRAERAEYIYVDGAMNHVGGIDLMEKDSMSISQLIVMAGGFKPEADQTKVRVLRPVMNTSKRSEISLNVSRILSGKDADFPILPNDLLYVPEKSILTRNVGKTLLVAIPLAITTAVLITRVN